MGKQTKKHQLKKGTKLSPNTKSSVRTKRRAIKTPKPLKKEVSELKQARERIHEYFSELGKKSWEARKTKFLTRTLK